MSRTDVQRGTNWEHNLSTPLPALSPEPSDSENISTVSASRLAFWRSTCALTRRLGGHIDVAVAPNEKIPAAVACFLPPGIRPGFISLLISGWLAALFRLGARTAYRFQNGYLLGEKLWHPALVAFGERYQDGAYVLVVGTDPSHAGHGHAAKLLQWQISRQKEESPAVPVYLETASDYAQRVYEKLGFEEVTRGQMNLQGVDERGCRISDNKGKPEDATSSGAPYFALR